MTLIYPMCVHSSCCQACADDSNARHVGSAWPCAVEGCPAQHPVSAVSA